MHRSGEAADRPAHTGRPSWRSLLRGLWSSLREDDLVDWAAALTYYAMLAIFPALIVFASLVGLAGQGAATSMIENLAQLAPGPGREIVEGSIDGLQRDRGAAGALLVVGLVVALWSASGYVGAFMRAAGVIWDVETGRPVWRAIPLRLGVTLLALLVISAGAAAIVLTGPVAEQAAKLIGVDHVVVELWSVLKWPALALLISILLALLYHAGPDVKRRGPRWITPGSVVAVLLWLAASELFALYVATFGSYNKTYGALGGVIAFLVWLWISNLAVLLGAELNAQLEGADGSSLREAPDR
ncbi:MAG: YihY/virulence factor BrkB family protein [Solirubrobacteraceae bacterium]|nr:YihY/virulence factor BrkB family protein [Solirubrobacteraceae bacterium]